MTEKRLGSVGRAKLGEEEGGEEGGEEPMVPLMVLSTTLQLNSDTVKVDQVIKITKSNLFLMAFLICLAILVFSITYCSRSISPFFSEC